MLNEGDEIRGIIRRLLFNADNEPTGLIVDVPGTAFIPRSLLPKSHRDSMETLIGKSFVGSVFSVDRERSTAIIQPSVIES